ncbi:MAG: ABC transporter ATP-binding protein [Acidimicrobiales bacterium]
MDSAFLSIDHVSVRHSNSTVESLCDVSFDVAAGEVIGVLGSSGSGKTTLLRAISGLQSVSTGNVVLDGVDITKTPTHLRGIGLMFQEHALFPHLDVADNVSFGLRMAKMPKPDRSERVAEVLELVGLAGFGSRDIASLSGGERQRVALARTIAPSPLLLLLDEPMGSLDRVLRDRLVSELGDLINRLVLTVVYVTHDRSEAFELADRIAVLDRGKLVQLDTPEILDAQPATAHVAQLLGHR